MDELEAKYRNMSPSQRHQEQKRIEQNIRNLRNDISRMEGLLHRMNIINDDISHHSKELYILKRQQSLAVQEAKVLCA